LKSFYLLVLTLGQKYDSIAIPAGEYVMKTKGSTSYTGVSIKELNKFFKEDAVIEVSKKFLNAHRMIAGENHVSLVVQKEMEPQIELKETQLDDEPVKKSQEPAIVAKLEDFM
tara:strand:+ start:1780 stop:2118 length:339 start_codon:yes stop_codon:yes gene_type:complete